jgi:hypothetical protein
MEFPNRGDSPFTKELSQNQGIPFSIYKEKYAVAHLRVLHTNNRALRQFFAIPFIPPTPYMINDSNTAMHYAVLNSSDRGIDSLSYAFANFNIHKTPLDGLRCTCCLLIIALV